MVVCCRVRLSRGELDGNLTLEWNSVLSHCLLQIGLDFDRFTVLYFREHRTQAPENMRFRKYVFWGANCRNRFKDTPNNPAGNHSAFRAPNVKCF